MPIYEYLCPVCQTKFEKRRLFSQADEPIECPQGHSGVERLRSLRPMILIKSEKGPYVEALPGTLSSWKPETSTHTRIAWGQEGEIPSGVSAIYEYLCAVCGTKFEQRRPMAQSGEPATCPQGHPDAKRVISPSMVVARDGFGTTVLPGTGSAPRWESLQARVSQEQAQRRATVAKETPAEDRAQSESAP